MKISTINFNMLMKQDEIRLLLIHSGKTDRYWAYVDKIIKETPSFDEFPSYYHGISDEFKTWFRITKIEEASNNIMGLCKVASSGATLGEASKHSMSPYFIIDFEEDSDCIWK